MNVQIPPIFFYAIGTLLVVFGVMRTLVLGRRRADRELRPDTPEAATARRRHFRFGIVWVLMGLFLIFSTAGVIRMRLPF
jgi:hypothetical protein